MDIHNVATSPFQDQKPGTSGLRKKVSVFQQPRYLENFVQSIFNVLGDGEHVLVVGGDGRYYNAQAIQTIIKMAAANGVKKLCVGRDGIFSTPAVSTVIRKYRTDGGIILSASHNPAGPHGDFGIKFNAANGGPAPEKITDAIFAESTRITTYRIAEVPEVDISRESVQTIGDMVLEVMDPVRDYLELLKQLFDFDKIGRFLAGGFKVTFDAMHAVTGPYARALFDALDAKQALVIHGVPKTDFGGGHPDPNLAHAKTLVDMLFSSQGPDFGAASDGDGDRNLILGRHQFVTPSDSLAVLTANAHLIPAYANGIPGVARSMPTSRAVDVVAAHMKIDCYETPTGWKFFGNLMDSGRVRLCGEESFGTGSDHIREKDGIWAVLMWLNILAEKKQSVREVMNAHWRAYGRHYYSRHDYEGIEQTAADRIVNHIVEQFGRLAGTKVSGLDVQQCDEFCYRDPVDGGVSENQGIRILLRDARIIFRLSGTGTQGATLRVYLEKYQHDPDAETASVLEPLVKAAAEISMINRLAGRDRPDVIT